MSDAGAGCCRCCCSFMFTLGLTALFLWLSLRASAPKCALIKFYIPALNQSLQPPGNTTLIFQVRLENTNKDKGVYYDPVNVTFYDSPTRNNTVANFIIPNFYQGHKKKATKGGEPNATGLHRQAVLKVVANGSAVFRVDLATSVRYKIIAWQTKRHRIHVGADFNISKEVNPKKDPVKSMVQTRNKAKSTPPQMRAKANPKKLIQKTQTKVDYKLYNKPETSAYSNIVSISYANLI